ncbi:MAG: hypothetical protein PWP24_871 [Clostridiales bacterium]|nr:hypothetical protein [Clostridiales bacterium]
MKQLLEHYKGLPKSIYVVCFSILVNRLGDFVFPFLSLYLTQKIGMSLVASGAVVTASSLIGIPSAFLGGKISDQYGRKKIYLIAQSASALFLIPCAFTKNAYVTVVCLLISTFFTACLRPTFNSMIADLLPIDKRQAGFSLKYLSINMGVSIGPIIAGFLFNNFLPLLFIGDALTSFLAVILIAHYVPETYVPGEAPKEEMVVNKAEQEEKGNIFILFYKRPYLAAFLLLEIIFCFVYSQNVFALPITLNQMYVAQGAKLYGYLMSINAVTVLALTAIIAAFTRKRHQLSAMALSGVMYAVGFGMIGFCGSYVALIVSTIIWTSGEILSSISSGVFLANNSPNNYRARLNALMSVVRSVGVALSTSFAGAYIQYFGVKSLWYLVFVLGMLSAVLMYFLRLYMKKVEGQKLN